jgi:hypothetical protein
MDTTCLSTLLVVERDTQYTHLVHFFTRWKGKKTSLSILMVVDRDNPSIFTLLVVDRDTPYTFTLLVVDRDTPYTFTF